VKTKSQPNFISSNGIYDVE